jgi:Hom_end-associated Hint
MPSNADTSNAARIQRLKAKTIANYHRLNPTPKGTAYSIKDASIQNELREGTMPYYQQTDTQTRTLVQDCCTSEPACVPPGQVSNIQFTYVSGTNPSNYVYNMTWNAAPNATSYTVTTTTAGAIVYSSSGTQAYIHFDDTNDAVFTITAINACGSNPYVHTIPACFPAGTKVHIVGGETKNIEDIQVGDQVIGAFGEHNPVLALQHVMVGNSKMYKINDEHVTTDHHPHVSLDKKFYTMDIKTIEEKVYGTNMPVINGEGKIEMRHLDGLNKGRIQKLTLGLTLKTIDGHREVTKIEEVPMAFDTKLYNLVTGGSHTYHADGYAVTGWPSERDFDYDTWQQK